MFATRKAIALVLLLLGLFVALATSRPRQVQQENDLDYLSLMDFLLSDKPRCVTAAERASAACRGRPANSRARTARPRNSRPRTTRPRPRRTTRPRTTRPKPRSTKPRPSRPRTSKPKSRKPKSTKPKSRKPRSTKPKSRKPKSNKPKSRKPKSDKPKSRKPKTGKPKSRKPKSTKPKSRKPKSDKPKSRKPKSDKPKSRKPKSDKPKSRKPKSDKPKAGKKMCASGAASVFNKDGKKVRSIKSGEKVHTSGSKQIKGGSHYRVGDNEYIPSHSLKECKRKPKSNKPKTGKPKSSKPKSEDPQPQEPQPQEPQPQEPQPEEPQPQEPQPQEPQPQEPQPEEPQPQEPQPQEPQEPQPEEPQPQEPQPEEPQPQEPQPQEPQPQEPQPRDPQPEEPQPQEPQPEEPQPQNPSDDERKSEDTLALIFGHEGGCQNSPADSGNLFQGKIGYTCMGVTPGVGYANKNGALSYASKFGGHPADFVKYAYDLSKQNFKKAASQIYQRQYFGPGGCTNLPQPIFYVCADIAVNSGPGRSKQYLNQLGAFNGKDAKSYARALNEKHRQDYKRWGVGSNSVFLAGWLARAAARDRYIDKY